MNLEIPLGYEEEMLEIQTLILAYEQPQIRNPTQNLQIYNRTVLLYGPPGTGKTLLAKYCAYKGKFNFIDAKPSKLKSKWVGGTSRNIAKLFEFAKQNVPCIIFLDEIESLICDRDSEESSNSDKNATNDILMEMNNIATTYDGVFVIGCSNRPYTLGSAPLRRFGKLLYIGKPSDENRYLMQRQR